jgi:RimJ/RimL family protein N-acetyltransferase
LESCFSDLRPVRTSEEIAKVVALARMIWVEHYSPLIGREQVNYMLDNFHSPEAIENEIPEKGFKFFLLENDGRDVGYLSFVTREDALFLSKLYILSSERGQGLGKRALAFLRDQAKRNNRQRIALTVAKKNSGSISAYEKIGFEKTGEVKTEIGQGCIMDDIAMELNI